MHDRFLRQTNNALRSGTVHFPEAVQLTMSVIQIRDPRLAHDLIFSVG